MTLSVITFSAKNERAIVVACLFTVEAVGLYATLALGDSVMMATMGAERGLAYWALLFAMWWTMMLAMMLPSATPAILTFSGVNKKLARDGRQTAALVAFIAGYLALWTAFSAGAVALQIMLENRIALDMMMATASVWLGAGLLVAAGLYQMSPLKDSCLHKCQAPLLYLARHWRNGTFGALRMGLAHGAYCVGCCWVLMGLLFYGGVMEPRWIVGLAAYVAAEKLIPAGNKLSHLTGLVLIGWGLFTL